MDAWILGLEMPGSPRQEVDAPGFAGANVDISCQIRIFCGQLPGGFLHQIQNFLRSLPQQNAVLRQGDPAVAPDK